MSCMKVRTQGDVKIYLLPSGVEIKYCGGQPIMDSGLENTVLILLFTERGWPMNKLREQSKQIGSDYLAECRKPINIEQIKVIRMAVIAALKPMEDSGLAKITDVEVKMKTGYQIYTTFNIVQPGTSAKQIAISGYGDNWTMQAEEAA